MNKLFYGDNLKMLGDYIREESVDLVYLDPPFNSNGISKDGAVVKAELFRAAKGQQIFNVL